jgi:hypothetical protein
VNRIIRIAIPAFCFALLVGCAREGAAPRSSPRDVAIFVHLVEKGSACLTVAGEEPARAHEKDKIVWEILNDCSVEQTVYFEKFKRNAQEEDPTDVNEKKKSVSAGRREKLKVGLKDIEASGKRTYKYNIRLNSGHDLDPELEVEY